MGLSFASPGSNTCINYGDPDKTGYCLPSVTSFYLKRKTAMHVEVLPLHMDKHFLGNH